MLMLMDGTFQGLKTTKTLGGKYENNTAWEAFRVATS